MKKRWWILWLAWIFTTLVGSAAGSAVVWAAYRSIGEIPAAMIFGGILGLTQWFVLRTVMPKSGSWVLANVLGIPLGLAAYNTVQQAPINLPNSILHLVLSIAACALVIGTAGWLALRYALPGTRRNLWWIPLTLVGWLLGGFAIFFWGPSLAEELTLTVDYAIIGLLVGLATGGGLVIITRKVAAPGEQKANRLFYLSAASCALALIIAVSLGERALSSPETFASPDLGAVPVCGNLPPRDCTGDGSFCSELVAFVPTSGTGYLDYPANGETWDNQYRSYLRRELVMLIQNVAARVACETAEWESRPFSPIGLGDMSESDGAIPGTSYDNPGHPPGTHEMGYMLDLAYFQNDSPDSQWRQLLKSQGIEADALRPVCKYTLLGIDLFHCTRVPHLLDPWRTALFIARLAESPRLRVIGVDGQVGPVIDQVLDWLVQAGWVDADLRENIPLAYETVDQGYGFYLFHHHHWHISLDEE